MAVDPSGALPVFAEYIRPNVYPRKSNSPSGTLQIRVFSSFTASFSVNQHDEPTPCALTISISCDADRHLDPAPIYRLAPHRTRCDKLARNFLAVIHLVATLYWVRL